MLSKEENERFTRVGRGTPGGELLRRYWWPVGFADQLKGAQPVTLPGLDDGRCILVWEQIKSCPPQYPRSGSAMAKKPLG